jgi:hypothetical protein
VEFTTLGFPSSRRARHRSDDQAGVANFQPIESASRALGGEASEDGEADQTVL